MKKIIKRVCLGLLIFIVVLVSALCVFLFSGGEKPTVFIPTVTDVNGKAYGVVEGDDGETMVVVTDAKGDRYAAHTNADGTPGETVAQINDKVAAEQLPDNKKNPVVNDTVSGNNFTGQVVTEPSVQTQPGNPQNDVTTQAQSTAQGQTQNPSGGTSDNNQTTSGDTTNPKYKIEKYQKLFMSNTYLMEFTTNDSELGDTPVTFATKNGNFVMDTTIEGMSCKILYIKSKNATYLLMDNFKKYSKLPEDMMGEDFDMSEMNMMAGIGNSDLDQKNIEVSEATINGQKLTCESYKAKDGSTMKYYFSGDTLVRIDSQNSDGTEMSTYISRITSDVPDSTFEIPKSYSYFNLSWLGALGGLGNSSKESEQ